MKMFGGKQALGLQTDWGSLGIDFDVGYKHVTGVSHQTG